TRGVSSSSSARASALPSSTSARVIVPCPSRGPMLPQGVRMRTLQLLRHAKSDWDRPAGDDHERVLAARGQRPATLVGVHLAQQATAPELVLCSTALRAVETWERAAAQLAQP